MKGGRQILCDIGVGVYTKEYFAAQTRYQLLGNGSQGHSVPILDGQYQCAGKQYAASEVSFANGCLSMNLLGAYGREGSLVRKFFIGDEGVTLTDAYQLAWTPKSIVERFVAYECPMVEEGKLVWRDTQMTFDQEQLECKITKQQYQNNFKGIFDVWLIDFVLKENNPEQTVRIEIRSMQ